MIKLTVKYKDKTHAVVFGLTYRNLDRMKEGDPILVNMNELGHPGFILINVVTTEESMVENKPSVMALNMTEETVEMLRSGGHLNFKTTGGEDVFNGEILIFADKDEASILEVLDKNGRLSSISKVMGGVCPTCRSGYREDGSCDCKESLQ